MKKILLYLLLLLAGKETIASGLPHQTATPAALVDTIYVSHAATTYLLFPQEVEMLDLGIGDSYHLKIEGRCVFLKAKDSKAPLTSLLINYRDTYLLILLAYTPAPTRYLYDFSRQATGKQASGKQLESKQAVGMLPEDTLPSSLDPLPGKQQHPRSVGEQLAALQKDPTPALLASGKRDNL